MTSYKSKLRTLNRVLHRYNKVNKRYDSITCYMEYDFLIIYFTGKTELFHERREKIPKNDIDETIKRYRDLTRYQELKLSENKNKTLSLNKKAE